MTDERNFRSSYYEKVGFRSVEEKRSLEILLKERPFDKAKLKQFCLRFTVPAIYRNFLWKVLLDIIPVYVESHEFIINQRKAEFQDLQKALKIAKILDDYTKPHLMFLTMWLLRTRRAKLDMNTQLEFPLHRAMSRMAETLWHIVDIDSYEEKLVDTYWILCGFLDQVQRFHKEINKLQECTCTLLEREDPELYKHLVKIEALYNIPYDIWFSSCFAGTISNGSIAKIWDKIAVGAYRILIFVTVVTLTTLRRLLMRCENIDSILNTIANITEETSEVIVNKAIESWQQSGSILTTIS
ncbi:TBC1 domain family member 7 [Apis mellifera caucasica]|uniref:TBC1 domain family member 7 n=1 Tax=Apis mellifera TaxID=7460 RepID=A0A7M7GN40_APIME|nr:TBC1 domain family member 7 [Apis mellifera]KAG6795205.1 TBC1 domain family member 7 [Apis mellifera caucasica]KAG9428626.1 TBC1 domain family member 7 [Apis mellifera carnica]|eukprot:XP_006560031.3 TBC1 domain family member 7 [Apis mellifera]